MVGLCRIFETKHEDCAPSSVGSYSCRMQSLASQSLAIHTYTAPLSLHQVSKLRQMLTLRGFRLEIQPHMVFCAQKDRLRIVVYQNGPKVLIQGKGVEEFVTFQLEPNV